MPEKKNEKQDLNGDRFVWKEGDLEYVGHQPLTEEQKELVKKLKEEDEE